MSKSFSALGVSTPVVRTLAERNIITPFAVQSLVLEDALAGVDILAASPTGSGKTLAFGIPIVERTSAGGNRPGALVLVPTRELASQVVEDLRPHAKAQGAEHRCRLRRHGTRPAGEARQVGAHPRRDARPSLRPDRARHGPPRRTCASSSSTRPTACSTWASGRRSTGSSRAFPRTGRRCCSRRRSTEPVADLARAYTSNPSRFRAEAPIEAKQGEIDHALRAGHRRRTSSNALVEQLDGERGLALVFVRTKHGADKLARKLATPARRPRSRDARQHVAERA